MFNYASSFGKNNSKLKLAKNPVTDTTFLDNNLAKKVNHTNHFNESSYYLNKYN